MKTKVLVVDDEPSLLRMLRAALEVEGYEVLLASDGLTGLQRIGEDQPKVVLLDVMMPLADGWTVLERLNGMADRPRVICLTAKDSPRDELRGWRLGADDYVTKPFDVDDLLRRIATVLERGPAERNRRRTEAIEQLGGAD